MVDYKKLNDKKRKELLKKYLQRLKPLFKPMGEPEDGDWLDWIEEEGQTFEEYARSKPKIPRKAQRKIYIQPLGIFLQEHRRVVTLVAEFLRAFYLGLPIVIKEDLSLDVIPTNAQRINSYTYNLQLLTTYILQNVLFARLPEDAAAYIAFTTVDLWPGKGWNFVFGQASPKYRVGVWSLHRYGNPSGSSREFLRCLIRTMKTGAHEIAHIFSLPHCITFQCLINGAMSLEEDDRKPLVCCPECMAKICWAIKADPIGRYEALERFCRTHGFSEEADTYLRLIDIIRTVRPNSIKSYKNL